MCGAFSQLCNPSPEIVNENWRQTYHSSVQNWAPQSLWFISSQIHEFRKSLSTLNETTVAKQIYESNQKGTEVLPLVWWMCLNKSLLPLKLGGWRKFEERTWEIYLWRAMDPEWTGLEVGKAAGRIHQHHQHLSSLPATPLRPTDRGLSLDPMLRHSAWAEHIFIALVSGWAQALQGKL